ncbi:CFA/I fimbrial chaperone [Klebsiella michiganensis]|uniref:CFA/I fimbrial chaperone n=1 Tax=Klebsiella michiganensis TaxID=1134687 RepID=A0A7H4LZ28_9ENTR|nr:CFA/I fimbrial chaperone [Klebsiella michiganensis]
MLICLLSLGFATAAQAISVGNLTFSLAAEDNFASKRVINNNKSARLYRVSIVAIDRPGGKEVRSRPADGELLFAPRQLTCRRGRASILSFTTTARKMTVSAITGSPFVKYHPQLRDAQ